ncbi:hypothetical protein [Amycolatopsis rubida]|uniref:Uncharacterized protein n=1 Tax=Amycolatopsis rubida TaxID=112413 RepID=A0A1I5X6L6_9PSEU|nr:hypothetical protein [Amycolatopsis rubida]SFQ27600.1 hypothetical protein SAMN05421854_11061 [Amycolatopsis rubida]
MSAADDGAEPGALTSLTTDELESMSETEFRRLTGASTDPADIALDQIEGVLFARIPDARERWEAVAKVARGVTPALEHVRAVCVAQLLAEGLSVAEAGQRLHINRQRAHALLAAHEQPTPRELRANPIRDEVGYRLGEFVGVVTAMAEELTDRREFPQALEQVEKLQRMISGSPAVIVARMRQLVTDWTLHGASRSLVAELDRFAGRLTDLPPHLPSKQEGHMWIAVGATTTRIRQSAQPPAP